MIGFVAGAIPVPATPVPLLVAGAQLLAVGLVLTWLYAQPELVCLLPGPQSLDRLFPLAGEGVRITREFGPPAPRSRAYCCS